MKTEHLEPEEIEFLRWHAERWMKLRHLPSVLWHYPGFVLRQAPRMCAHTFRGSSWKSAIGLESSWQVFQRYRRIRARERDYLGEAAGDHRPRPAHRPEYPDALQRRSAVP